MLKPVASDVGIQIRETWMDVILGIALGDVLFVAGIRVGAAWDDVWAQAYDDALTWVTFQLQCSFSTLYPVSNIILRVLYLSECY